MLLILDCYDRDEALWRAFLAAHFGRESTDDEIINLHESAAMFLCAFGRKPFWTWTKTTSEPTALRKWLHENPAKLKSLFFGNHRKYESNKPDALWRVIHSFLALVRDWGGRPSGLFDVDGIPPKDRFDELYWRLRHIWRFGRTARFDFLSLLNDLDLVKAEPSSCYLCGATGPLIGARKLWGRDKTPRELGALADDLAMTLKLSPFIVEDALCNWQKD